MINVQVQTLVGEQLNFEVEEGFLARELKQQIAEAWDLIPECVKLIVGTSALDDLDTLCAYLEEGTSAVIILALVSLEQVHARMQSGNHRARIKAMAVLKRLVSKPDDAFYLRLKDPDVEVRSTAVQMLSHLSEKGDERTINAIKDCLVESAAKPFYKVRYQAILALAKIVDVSNHSVVTSIMQSVGTCLKDTDEQVSKGAIELLAELAGPGNGDERAIAVVVPLLSDPKPHVLVSALRALARICAKGDQTAIEQVKHCLMDSPDHFAKSLVRVAALEALSHLCLRGSSDISGHMCTYLEDPSENVRLASLKALGLVADVGDVFTIAAIVGQLQSRDFRLRQTAIETLADLASPGDANVLRVLASELEDREQCVRQAAVLALQKVATPGQEDALSFIYGHMKHPKADVRQAAVQAYAEISNVGNRHAIDILGEAMEDHRPHVRQAAADGLLRLARAGDPYVCEVVSARVDHAQVHVRSTAMELAKTLELRGHS